MGIDSVVYVPNPRTLAKNKFFSGNYLDTN